MMSKVILNLNSRVVLEENNPEGIYPEYLKNQSPLSSQLPNRPSGS